MEMLRCVFLAVCCSCLTWAGRADPAGPRLFTWVELIGFDNTKADYGVGDYLSRMDLKPEVVSLLLNDDILYLRHKPGRVGDEALPEGCCSYNGRPFSRERRRQVWTLRQLRGLVAELKKGGCDAFASFFARHDMFPVSDERAGEIASLLPQFLVDIGFTGLHGSDGYSPPRYLLETCSDRDRAKRARARAERFASNWTVLAKALKEKGLKVWLNTCWTRDPYEALYRYGVDYRLMAKTGVDGFVVESSAAMQEIEGWNFQESSALDRSTAMLARLKACVPDMPFVLLHAINDGTEQWSALRHAPTRTASEAIALGNVFCGGRRALQGYLACLADGVGAGEWRELSRTWRLSFASKESVGVRAVWSDRAFDAEFDACSASRDASSNTLLAELIRHGLFFAGSVRVEDALEDRTMPLLVLNPQFFPDDELAALKDRTAPVVLFGRGAPASTLLGEYEMRARGAPPFPGFPEEKSCYWKKPLAENVPSEKAFKHAVWEANTAASVPFAAGSPRLRPFAGRLEDGRLLVCGRNEGATYLDTEVSFTGGVSDVTVLRDFPSLPIRTDAKVRVAPWDTMVLAVRERMQPIPASVMPAGLDQVVPRIFLWAELIAFDNTRPDFGVGEYLSRHDIKPEMVALLLGDDQLYFIHKPGSDDDFGLTKNCSVSANGRPFNRERRSQAWTTRQVRALVAELAKNGVKTLASFFARHDKFPVAPERAEWMAPRLAAFLADYGFAGFHAADGYAPPRYLLPSCADADRARIARERARRYADNFRTLLKPLKEKGLVCWANSCWTRDPFESLYRYGVDHRLLVEAGVDGFVVESSAAMQEIEGWNYQDSSALDRSTAMLMRLKASVPDTPLVLLHAIGDDWEQWNALRHDPTRTASEALALGGVFYGGKRALEGYLACLADGIGRSEWRELDHIWRLSMAPAKGPVGVRVVWSDRAFDAEFEASVTNKFANSNTLLYELIHHGAFIGGAVSVRDALADKSLPLLILNPDYFPMDELSALRNRLVPVFEFGRGGEWPYDHPYEMLPPDTAPFPGMPENSSCYWKKPIPEHRPPPESFKALASSINWKTAPCLSRARGMRIFGYRQADGRLAVFGRNEGETYLNGVLLFSDGISDIEVLRDFPSLPVKTSLSGRIAPHDTMMLSVGEHEQPIPGSTTDAILK